MDNLKKTSDAEVIEIQGENIEMLFSSFDPSPISRRRLNSELVNYVLDRIDPKDKNPVNIVISNFPEGNAILKKNELAQIIRRQIKKAINMANEDLRANFRLGLRTLLVALIILMTCLGLSTLFEYLPFRIFQSALIEGFVIIGWVILWHPIEILVFDWWPISEKKHKLERLAKGEIIVM
jgi:hypothetical protein